MSYIIRVPQSLRCTCISTWSSRWRVRGVQVLCICTRVVLDYKSKVPSITFLQSTYEKIQ